MKYFNIRYECIDARDDYATQKRQEIFLNYLVTLFGPFIDELDDQNVQDRAVDGLDIKDIAERIEADWDDMGKHAANRLHQMMEMEKILLTSGWLNHSENRLWSSTAGFIHGDGKSYYEWKELLAQKKASILESPGNMRHKGMAHLILVHMVSWLITPML